MGGEQRLRRSALENKRPALVVDLLVACAMVRCGSGVSRSRRAADRPNAGWWHGGERAPSYSPISPRHCSRRTSPRRCSRRRCSRRSRTSWAIGPPLVLVGVMMMRAVRGWGGRDDMRQSMLAFQTLVLMPLTYSITCGHVGGIGPCMRWVWHRSWAATTRSLAPEDDTSSSQRATKGDTGWGEQRRRLYEATKVPAPRALAINRSVGQATYHMRTRVGARRGALSRGRDGRPVIRIPTRTGGTKE